MPLRPCAGLVLVLCLGVLVISPAHVAAAGDAQRGKAVFALAAGCGCHTSNEGPAGAGGGQIATPFGTFYGTNITPDPETGIGAWTDAEIRAAIRDGVTPGKGVQSPAMPYYRYAGMSDADLDDLIAYLRALPPVRRENRPHEGELPLARLGYRAWRLLFVDAPQAASPSADRELERGRYLVDHVSICGDCHTPRNALGVPIGARHLGGTPRTATSPPVPNLTPHESGLRGWDEEDVVSVLSLGMLPNFDNVQGLMAEVVDGKGGGPGYSAAPPADLRAIAVYLRSLPPIDNGEGDD